MHNAYTYIHTDTYTNIYRHALTHMYRYVYTCAHMCTHIDTCICRQHICTDTHAHTINIYTCIHRCVQMYPYMHTCTHTPTLIKSNNFQSVYPTSKLPHPDQPSFQVTHQTPREARGLLTSQWWTLRAFLAELTALLCTLCCDITAVGVVPDENPGTRRRALLQFFPFSSVS